MKIYLEYSAYNHLLNDFCGKFRVKFKNKKKTVKTLK